MRTVRERFVAEITCPHPPGPGTGLPSGLLENVRQALTGHGVVVLRGTRLQPAGLEALARGIGSPRPVPHPHSFPPHPDSRYVQVIDSTSENGPPRPDTSRWHTDNSFRPEPVRYTVLQAHALPPSGGDTLFADVVRAYQKLPRPWKAALVIWDNKRVLHRATPIPAGARRVMHRVTSAATVPPVNTARPASVASGC